MEFKELINPNLIFLNQSCSSKEEVFDLVGNKLLEQGIISDIKKLKAALYERESESPTGLENGVAIPHAKSSCVKECAVSLVTLEKPIDNWLSIDSDNKVSIIFLLTIPEKKSGDTHIELLSQLSRKLMDPQFVDKVKDAVSSKDIIYILDEKSNDYSKKQLNNGIILAVTACTTGIAHTYMAAEALERAGDRLGYKVLVEKQGANGIEDRPKEKEIKDAIGLIIANDVDLQNMSIYNGIPHIKTKVAEPIKNADVLIQKIIQEPCEKYSSTEETGDLSKKRGLGTEMYQALMSGISYMIPIVVGAGLMTAIAQIGGLFFGIEGGTIGNEIYANSNNSGILFLYNLNLFGGFIFSLMYPVLSGFMANAIAGKVGITAGFIGGSLAGGLMYSVTGIENRTPSGFIGAIAIGYLAGYFCRFLNKKIHLHKNIQSLKPMLIIPLFSILVVYLANATIFEPIGGGLNNILFDIISNSSGTYTVAIVIAMATAFDMGGPVNKAAFAVTLALAANHSFPMTANILGCIIPPLGIGMAVILNQYIFKKKIFDDSLESAGYTSFISGIIGVSEGAIPFALRDPLLTIPLNVLGSALAAIIATMLKVEIWFPIPQFWGWPLIKGLPQYLISLIIGILFVALGNIFIRDYINNKKKKVESKKCQLDM